jgi:DNA-binding MarR family transcriptional regulator
MPGASDDTRVVLDGIRRLVQFLRVTGRPVSSAQVFVLQTLAESPAPLSVNELAARTLTHQSSVSVVLKRLEESRLVSKRPGQDGRRVEVSLTGKGRQALRRMPDAPQGRLIAGLQRMAARQRRELARGLGGLLVALGVPSKGAPPMFFEERRRP